MKRYLPRVYDSVLKSYLEAHGAVLIEGLKWCGKTTTAEQIAKSVIYFQDPEHRSEYQTLAQLSASALLEGKTPRLMDEWQEVPQVWDAVRFAVDKRQDFGQFILTGSSVPVDPHILAHSGTGRIARLKMGTMSLFESQDSTGKVSLGKLFNGEKLPNESSSIDLQKLAYLACRGGWPRSLGVSKTVALRQAYDYLDAVCEVDVSRVDEVTRNAETTRMLLRSYARMISSQGTLENIRQDMEAGEAALGKSSFLEYIQALKKIFIIDDLPAWNPNLRSKTAIRTSPTRHFADPSIAVAALGASPNELINDLNTFGLIFEDLCIRDLRCYAKVLDGSVFHFRDKNGLECDAVVHLRNGNYGLIEVKLGGDKLIEEGASNLRKLASKIDTKRMNKPSFLMILVGVGSFSYMRPDGVMVVPIGTLGA